MIDYPTFCQLRLLLDEQHLSASQVAAQLKLDPKTVANWVPRTSPTSRIGPQFLKYFCQPNA